MNRLNPSKGRHDDNLPLTSVKIKPRRRWFLIAPLLVCLLIALVNLSEWYKIGIIKETAGYPFGGEGPVPYYYRTPGLYALVNGVSGFAFLCLSALSTWSFIRYKRRRGSMVIGIVVLVIVIAYVNGLIGP
jgi:hypothetical protein